MKALNKNILFIAVLSITLTTCRRDEPAINYSPTGYPNDIGKIILTRCATAGCHTDKSKDGAAGLSLETWDKMFEGGNGGAAVIPYSSKFSTLFYYINTFSDLGVTLTPTMPYNQTPLSRDEVTLIRNWIDQGAPDRSGFVKWSDNPGRRKYYVVNQGCDVVCAFDQEKRLQMRYYDVGTLPTWEAPHNVKVSPDGQNWYVSFIGGSTFQKFRTSDDALVANISITSGSWNTFAMTSDSKIAFCVDLAGRVAIVDLVSNSLYGIFTVSGLPHGSFISPDDKTLYVTNIFPGSKSISKIDITDPYSPSTQSINISSSAAEAHEGIFSPDGSRYFLACQKSSEVRVFNASNDARIDSIPVGYYPQEMAISKNPATPYLFVTCMEDTLTFPGKRGSVYVINYLTNTVVAKIFTGWQPHGIALDDDNKVVVVVNRNVNPNGPAPHHSSNCGGRNGNVVFIDLSTLQLTGKRIEVSTDSYQAAYRR